MLEITVLQGVWFALIGILIAGYFILDGFDLGIGVLYPFLGKNDRDKALLRRAVGPVWDGNEVWLLTAGGALFAAFPPAYATSFSGFYLAIMLVLFGLIGRAIALEFRGYEKHWSKLFDGMFFVGSLLPALLCGVALGNVLVGIQLDAYGNYIGGLFALLNPFALLCGVLGLVACITLGASWLAVKTPVSDPIYDKAARIRFVGLLLTLVLFAFATLCYFSIAPQDFGGTIDDILSVVFGLVAAVGIVVALALGRKKADMPAHIALSVACACFIGCTACGLFPLIIPASDLALSITIAGAAASEYALTCMTIITCIGLPLVLLYHVVVYRTFRGKISDEDLLEY